MKGPGGAAKSAVRKNDEKALFAAFAALASPAEAGRFLRDIATPGEIQAFAERWRIARLLWENKMSYREIAAETGASTTTVGRVARFLNDEDHGGYRQMLSKSESS